MPRLKHSLEKHLWNDAHLNLHDIYDFWIARVYFTMTDLHYLCSKLGIELASWWLQVWREFIFLLYTLWSAVQHIASLTFFIFLSAPDQLTSNYFARYWRSKFLGITDSSFGNFFVQNANFLLMFSFLVYFVITLLYARSSTHARASTVPRRLPGLYDQLLRFRC